MRSITITFLVLSLAACTGCGEDPIVKNPDKFGQPKDPVVKPLTAPDFSADSAYSYLEAQVNFGPRVPNTEAHRKCGEYLAQFLRNQDLEVIEQKAVVTAFNGTKLNIVNVIGQYKPELKDRILLFAHWDTRPFADRDTKDTNKPIDGANDGGSGVAVLMEVARQLKLKQPDKGIDIIFFDAEDYGQPVTSMGSKEDTWCLGTQYWTKNLHTPGYKAEYGILLDMVGARGAVFPLEGTSTKYASGVQQKVWHMAHRLGYKSLFVNKPTGETIDDHLYVNRDANIPSVNIVHYEPVRRDYFGYHHTHGDCIDKIDKSVLNAVGEVVMAMILHDDQETS